MGEEERRNQPLYIKIANFLPVLLSLTPNEFYMKYEFPVFDQNSQLFIVKKSEHHLAKPYIS